MIPRHSCSALPSVKESRAVAAHMMRDQCCLEPRHQDLWSSATTLQRQAHCKQPTPGKWPCARSLCDVVCHQPDFECSAACRSCLTMACFPRRRRAVPCARCQEQLAIIDSCCTAVRHTRLQSRIGRRVCLGGLGKAHVSCDAPPRCCRTEFFPLLMALALPVYSSHQPVHHVHP